MSGSYQPIAGSMQMRVLLGRLLRRDAGRGCDELLVVIFPGSTGRSTEAAFFDFRPVRTQPAVAKASRRHRAEWPVLPGIVESDTMKPEPPGHLGVACQNRT
jgi:hypothetical protein